MARGKPGRRATISDVASAAGVSRATVSRALSDSPLVTEETKERIRSAVAETGFVMNAQGRALAVGRAESIAIVVTEPLDEFFSDPTYASVLRGVAEGLAETPTMPMLLQAWTEAERRRAMRHFERRAVDAVISISPYVGGDLLTYLTTSSLPVVLCGQLEGDPYRGQFASVYADDTAGARIAARRMAEGQRRRIAVINGPADNPAAADRLHGYRAELGDRFDADLYLSTGWDTTSGYEAMRRLLERAPDIDGVLAGSDRIAIGALTALTTAGRSIPADVAVIGFDDHAIAATSTPPLTTVHQPLRKQGRIAAGLALGMIDGAPAETVVLDMRLVERASA